MSSLRSLRHTPAVGIDKEKSEVSMIQVSAPVGAVRKSSAMQAIAVGGLVGGSLDLLQACIKFGWDIPLAIAGGVLGKKAFGGGPGTYILGVLLHYFIATTAAATYYAASRRLTYLRESWVVCGLFFGAAVDTFMRLVVLPLSALHGRGPYEWKDLVMGLVAHSIVIGLPIAFCVRRFGN